MVVGKWRRDVEGVGWGERTKERKERRRKRRYRRIQTPCFYRSGDAEAVGN